MRPPLGGGALALVVSAGLPALAADSRLSPPDLERYARWGPLRARPTLELSDVGYDDNILADTDDKIGDYTATLSPALDGLVLFGDRAFLEFLERIELTGYVDNPDQSFANQRGSGRITAPFGSFGVFADFRLDRTKDRPIDLQDLRPERAVDGLGAGIVLRPGARTELELARRILDYRHTDPDYEASGQDIADRLDRREHRTTIAGDYELFGRTRLTLDAGYETIDFDAQDSLGRDKDSDGWTVMPGIDFGEDGSLSGSARLGWAVVDARDAALADFSAAVGEAELVYRPRRRSTIQLGLRSKPAFAIYEDATYVLERSLTLGGVYYLVRPLGVEASAEVGRLTFPGGETDRVDRLTSYDVGLRLRVAADDLGRRVEYSLLYRRDVADSSIDTLDRDRSAIGVNAVVGY